MRHRRRKGEELELVGLNEAGASPGGWGAGCEWWVCLVRRALYWALEHSSEPQDSQTLLPAGHGFAREQPGVGGDLRKHEVAFGKGNTKFTLFF